jgi:hypothetical protein
VNLFLDTRYDVKHAVYFLILEILFPHAGDGDVKDPPNAAMEEDFKAV